MLSIFLKQFFGNYVIILSINLCSKSSLESIPVVPIIISVLPIPSAISLTTASLESIAL